MRVSRRRWSDNDRHFGPFLFSAYEKGSTWRPTGIVLESGDGDDRPGCHLLFQIFGYTLIIELPAIIKPWQQWVDTSSYSWSTSPNGGYWDKHNRQFGFRLSDGFLQVFLGPQTNDSITTKSWSKTLPWTDWRHIRFSIYDAQGDHFYSQFDDKNNSMSRYEELREQEEICPVVKFHVTDFDGTEVIATTRIEEREWHFGSGYFKWLSLFRRAKIRRSLSINFSAETGPEKGSWKGGLCGTSISMTSGESHESAFKRYCEEDHRSKYRKYKVNFGGAA